MISYGWALFCVGASEQDLLTWIHGVEKVVLQQLLTGRVLSLPGVGLHSSAKQIFLCDHFPPMLSSGVWPVACFCIIFELICIQALKG